MDEESRLADVGRTDTKSPRRPARAEVVGSLLRPATLKAAVEAFYAEGHSAVLAEEGAKDRTALAKLEDEAIRESVQRQIDLGLDNKGALMFSYASNCDDSPIWAVPRVL